MIAGCPKCSARYRVDPEQVGESGAKLRCTKCSAVFLVRAPQSASAAPTSPEPVARASAAPTSPEPVARASATPSAPIPPADVSSDRLVLVADPIEARAKQTAAAIESWGLTPVLVHDGVEAMLEIQRRLPNVVVLDAALPKMFGFQVCEVIKRNESLRHIRTVLVGAIHDQDRYRRDPSDLYDADAYLEEPDLPDGLIPTLREAGLRPSESGGGSQAVAPGSRPVEPALEPPPPVAPAPAPVAPPVEEPLEFEQPIAQGTPSPAPVTPTAVKAPGEASSPELEPNDTEDPELAVERERAERLARIAVSEMLLYQPDKFDQAIRDGNVEAVLDLEIQEARALIRQRISEEVRAERDFILEELERVVGERSDAP